MNEIKLNYTLELYVIKFWCHQNNSISDCVRNEDEQVRWSKIPDYQVENRSRRGQLGNPASTSEGDLHDGVRYRSVRLSKEGHLCTMRCPVGHPTVRLGSVFETGSGWPCGNIQCAMGDGAVRVRRRSLLRRRPRLLPAWRPRRHRQRSLGEGWHRGSSSLFRTPLGDDR